MFKKVMLVGALACLGLTLMVGSANAAAAWYIARVDFAGPSTGSSSQEMYMMLTSVNDSWSGSKWFSVASGDQYRLNTYLATLLTAVSTGKCVYVNTDLAEAVARPHIGNLYVLADTSVGQCTP